MSHAPRIRALLLRPESRGGMTNKQVGMAIGVAPSCADRSLDSMPDAHIADWLPPPPGVPGQPSKLWKVVEVPKDAKKPTPKTRKARKP